MNDKYKSFDEWSKNRRKDGKTDKELQEQKVLMEQEAKELIESYTPDAEFSEDEINQLVENVVKSRTLSYMSYDEYQKAKADGTLDEKASGLEWMVGGAAGGVAATTAAAAGVGGALTAGAFIAAMAGAMGTSTLWRNRKAIHMKLLEKWGKTTRSVVQKMLFESLKAFVSKHKLKMSITQSGEKITILSGYTIPDNPPAKITITVSVEGVVVFPENTGGSGALESIMFNAGKIDISPKRTVSRDIERIINDAGGLNNILGKGYKIPAGKVLNYQEHLVKIWYVCIDIMSEIFADYATYYSKMVASMQRTKNNDAQPFIQLANKVDLDKYLYADAKKAGLERYERENRGN